MAIANPIPLIPKYTSYNSLSKLSLDLSFVVVRQINRPIEHNGKITYLGVVLDEKLKFNGHIHAIRV